MPPGVELHQPSLISLSEYSQQTGIIWPLQSKWEPPRWCHHQPLVKIPGVGCHVCGHLHSHKCVLAKKAGGATALAEEKARKYTHLDRAYLLQQVARVSGPRLIALSTRPWSCTYLLCVFNFIIVIFSGIY